MGKYKRLRWLLFGGLLLLILAVGIGGYVRNTVQERSVGSTDLSGLNVNGIFVGKAADSHVLSELQPNPDYKNKTERGKKYQYYDGVLLVSDEASGAVTRIQLISDTLKASVGEKPLKTLADADRELGDQFVKKPYSHEQGLDARVYYDKERGVRATLVYPGKDTENRGIVWTIIERY